MPNQEKKPEEKMPASKEKVPVKEKTPGAEKKAAEKKPVDEKRAHRKRVITHLVIAVIIIAGFVTYAVYRIPKAEVKPQIEIVNVSGWMVKYDREVVLPIFLEENRMLCNALLRKDKAVCSSLLDTPNGTLANEVGVTACTSMIDLMEVMEAGSADACHFDEEPYNDPLAQLVCISSIRGDASICDTTPLPKCELIMSAFLGEISEDEMMRRLNEEDPEFAADFDASNFKFFKALINRNPATCDTMDEMSRDDISYFKDGRAGRNKYICKAMLGQDACGQI